MESETKEKQETESEQENPPLDPVDKKNSQLDDLIDREAQSKPDQETNQVIGQLDKPEPEPESESQAFKGDTQPVDVEPEPDSDSEILSASQPSKGDIHPTEIEVGIPEVRPSGYTNPNTRSDFQYSRRDYECTMSETNQCVLAGACAVALLLTVILLPLSFTYFEYYELGFVKNTVTNNVNTNNLYEMGVHYTGVGFKKISYPRVLQRVDAHLAVFPEAGQEFYINLIAFYRIGHTQEALATLYESFGTVDIHSQALTRIETTVKGLSPLFTLSEYTANRKNISDTFFYGTDDMVGVAEDLTSIGLIIDRDRFWIGEVALPDVTLAANLDAAVQVEINEQEQNNREATLVEAETVRQSEEILANLTAVQAESAAAITQVNGDADAAIVTIDSDAAATMAANMIEAEATASSVLLNTDGAGYADLFTRLNVTGAAVKAKYIQYFVLQKQ